MSRTSPIRVAVALSQSGVAALFGIVGFSQRNRILSQPFIEGQTLWNTTAQFHVWPWPLKFAIIENFPAFVASTLLSLPLRLLWPQAPEAIDFVTLMPLVFVLWYWIGGQMQDNRLVLWSGFLMAAAAVGAFLPLGHVGYVPYGIVLWIVVVAALRSRQLTGGDRLR